MLGYATFSKHTVIEARGVEGYAVDLLATGLFFAAIVAAIYIVKYKRTARDWFLPAPENGMGFVADRLLHGVIWASIFMGIIGLMSADVLLLILLPMDLYIEFTALGYALIKGVWAGALAMLVVYMAVRCGLKINNAQNLL